MTTNTTPAPVRVEIWSDPQCIWCYIAGARFRTAVTRFDGDVDMVYRSYQLTPDAALEIDRAAHIRRQRIPNEKMKRVMAQLAELTAAEGLAYDPERTQPTNSHLALELLHHAGAIGQRAALTARLFRAYFAEGRHIGRIDELVPLAGEIGLDETSAREVLIDRRYSTAVDADMQTARTLGVQGVPFYVINDTWGISGAQPTEHFLTVLKKAVRS